MTENDKQLFLEVIKGSVADAVRITVNGKIDKLHDKIDSQGIELIRQGNALDNHIKDNIIYIKEDEEWKQKAQPALDVYKNLTGTWKIIAIVATGISAIIGGTMAVFSFINFFKK